MTGMSCRWALQLPFLLAYEKCTRNRVFTVVNTFKTLIKLNSKTITLKLLFRSNLDTFNFPTRKSMAQ